MTIIDHLSFPHIIDLIWFYTDYEWQLPLRVVCKTWRERADNRLHHIVLRQGRNHHEGRSYEVGVPSLDQLRPRQPLTWLFGKREAYFDPRDFPLRPVEGTGQNKELTEDALKQHCVQVHLYDSMEHLTEVVDFRGYSDTHATVFQVGEYDFLLSRALNRPCLRWFGEPPHWKDPNQWSEPPRIRVIMFDLRPPSTDSWTVWRAREPPRIDINELECRQEPLVVNYFCYADPTAAHLSGASVLGTTACHFDEILTVDASVSVLFHNNIPGFGAAPPQLNIGFVLAYSRLIRHGCAVEIVGLELFMSETELAAFKAEVRREVAKDIELGDGLWKAEEECLDWLSFATHRECRERVGEEVYRVHTIR